VTSRASVSSTGAQADTGGGEPALSGSGRYVAFSSSADNLVAGDTNGPLITDVFVRDRLTGVTQRVSVGSGGEQATATSLGPALSSSGRYVAFTSAARRVPADTDAFFDAYVRDLATGDVRRLSSARSGGAPNGASFGVAISADGRRVAFDSYASNLVAGDTNGVPDVFVRDRWTGVTSRVSVGAGGAQGNGDSGGISTPAISGDGRYVAFTSLASNLVAGDTNGVTDVFTRDLRTGVTRRMSLTPTGRAANGGSESVAISSDGRIVAFASYASNLVAGDTNGVRDVFVRDRWTGVTRLVSVASDGIRANGSSAEPAVSGDGLRIGFSSDATNLVPNDTNDATDVFVRDPASEGP
jgi:Tol biopolymer transport system component